MPHNGGWVKLYRQIFDNALFAENHEARHLFTDLLMLVAYEPDQMDWRGKPVDIARGQYMISVRKLSDKTGFSVRKVRTILTHLRSHGVIKIDTLGDTGPMIITICNYCEFQDIPDLPTHQATSRRHTGDTPGDKQIKKKEVKKEENIDLCRFDEFWDVYGYKIGSKPNAKKAWQKALTKTTADEIIEGVRRYKAWLAAKGDRAPNTAHASTWLNGERWNDELEVDNKDADGTSISDEEAQRLLEMARGAH